MLVEHQAEAGPVSRSFGCTVTCPHPGTATCTTSYPGALGLPDLSVTRPRQRVWEVWTHSEIKGTLWPHLSGSLQLWPA